MDGRLSHNDLRFCRENGLDPALVRGEVFDAANPARRDPLSVVGAFGNERPMVDQLDALVIDLPLRFGNAMLQLAHALNFALRFAVPTLYHPGIGFLRDNVRIEGVRIRQGKPAGGRYLMGRFYYTRTCKTLSPLLESRRTLIRRLAPHLTFAVAPGTGEADSGKELHIHIRSGDVFRANGCHYQYGQPPLAFYAAILRREPWSRVTLIYEDDRNPVIGALKTLLESVRIPYRVHSQGLRRDLEALCRAEHLVIGRGTFIYPLLCLSQRIKRVFVFEDDQRRTWGLENAPIEFIHVVDRTGMYKADVLTFWTNTEEQLKLMLTYGEEDLEVIPAGTPVPEALRRVQPFEA